MTEQPRPKPARKPAAAKAEPSPARRHPLRPRRGESDHDVMIPKRRTPAPPVAPAPPAAPAAAEAAPGAEPLAAAVEPALATGAPSPTLAVSAAIPPDVRSIDHLDVDQLEVSRVAIGGVRAGDVAARQAVVGGIAAGQASVEMGAVNGIAAREVTVQQGAVRAVLAQNVHVEQAIVRSVVANRVETGPTTAILVALARRIDGEAKVLLDWRGALALGAVLGAAYAAVRLLRRG
jgi:hypothetical protein